MTAKDFFQFAEQHKALMVDLKFTDLLGSWQHCSFPIETWDESTFEHGVGFDGSSIRGWQGIHQSDMLAVPDPSTAVLDPFFERPTVSVIADIRDPVTHEDYTRDPRHVARKAEAIGGVLRHARSMLAFAAPTSNSYRRLVPGFEAPVNLAYSQRNRSACVRIPMYFPSPKAKRLEFRCPDPSCNGYLMFSAMLMAVLDGVENEIDPGDALDRDIYDMTREELAHWPHTPGSLDEALSVLGEDHAFLTKGDVFTDDLIEAWIDYKMENEVEPLRLRPHPYEFFLYYDN